MRPSRRARTPGASIPRDPRPTIPGRSATAPTAPPSASAACWLHARLDAASHAPGATSAAAAARVSVRGRGRGRPGSCLHASAGDHPAAFAASPRRAAPAARKRHPRPPAREERGKLSSSRHGTEFIRTGCNNWYLAAMAELKTRILIVDNDQRLRDLLVRYLGGEGYE